MNPLSLPTLSKLRHPELVEGSVQPAFLPLRWSGLLVARTREARRKRISPLAALALILLLALPLVARADSRPDFDDDAKPILRAQPDLIHYVKQHFDVQETGFARTPGTDDRPPAPPYIFRARPRGSSGPFTITLFIQPGPPGHILLVKPDHGPASHTPAFPPQESPVASAPSAFDPSGEPSTSTSAKPAPSAPAPAPSPAAADANPAPVSPSFSNISSDTPSGPIKSDSSGASLAPPPDPAPAH